MNTFFTTYERDLFFNELNILFNIDISTLINLFNLGILENIFSIDSEIVFFNDIIKEYSFPLDMKLIEDYDKLFSYVFATYPSYDNSFKIIEIYDENFILNKNEINISINIPLFYSDYTYIEIFFNADIYHYSNYDTSLLNEFEKENFFNFILKHSENIYDFDDFEEHNFFSDSLEIDFDYSLTLQEKYLEFEKIINQHLIKYQNFVNEIKEESIIFFERPFLEKEIVNF